MQFELGMFAIKILNISGVMCLRILKVLYVRVQFILNKKIIHAIISNLITYNANEVFEWFQNKSFKWLLVENLLLLKIRRYKTIFFQISPKKIKYSTLPQITNGVQFYQLILFFSERLSYTILTHMFLYQFWCYKSKSLIVVDVKIPTQLFPNCRQSQ